MNGVRRALLVIYSLLLIAAAGGFIALSWTQDQKLDLKIRSFNLQALVTSSDNAKYLATVMFGAVALIGLITLLIAVARETRRSGSRGTIRMRQTDGGSVEVTAAAVENLLRDELQRLPEIRRVSPRVRVNAGAVDTFLDATIEPSASISHVTNVLGQGVASVLRDQVGVTNIRRPSVRINYGEPVDRPAPPPRMQPPSPPLTPPPLAPASPKPGAGEGASAHE